MPSIDREISLDQKRDILYKYAGRDHKDFSDLIGFESDIYSKIHERLDKLLQETCYLKSKADWAAYFKKYLFPKPDPIPLFEDEIQKIKPPGKYIKEPPIKPDINSEKYRKKGSFLSRLVFWKKVKKIRYEHEAFETDIKKWEYLYKLVTTENESWKSIIEADMRAYDRRVHELQRKYNINEWIKEKEYSEKIFNEAYADYENEGLVISFIRMLINSSIYPIEFKKEFDIEFNSDNNILIIDYLLPSIASIPIIKELKYIEQKDIIKEFQFTEKELKIKYDKLLYDITLRTILEVFLSDYKLLIGSINFNGWIDSIDKSSGKNQKICILSVHVERSAVENIDIKYIDSKSWFKKNKGLGGIGLSELTPIRPIMSINREDKRFVPSHNVEINESINLAAMDWEEFEHLVRELFQKELISVNGEVKVTRASRDGGVDAVAFNPDPIIGGKIIIQAKRYTNTVGVAAVRDLYGTVINEGANRGILVTTSDYGSDAWNFAKDKPITLLNGANLLSLLEKHGQKARIDIEAARKLLGES